MRQASLFDYPRRAGYKVGGTSQEAATGIEATHRAENLRHQVKQLFWTGFEGTADEVAALLNEDRLAIRPRVSELHVNGLIVETGERRRNPGGRAANVWRAT